MGRNRELIRQWSVLQKLAARRTTIAALAQDFGVNARTIRRDLDALQAAGFPIYDDTVNGTKFWRVDARELLTALSRNALTVPEICALYSSRALVKGLAGAHVLTDLQGVLDKIEAALPPAMKKFFDRLPQVITAKAAPGKRRAARGDDHVARLADATMAQRIVSMRYHSMQSGRVKDYQVHPYRLVYTQHGVYLQAFVPACADFRTFLLDRIQRLTVEEQSFERAAELASDPFGKSLGVHTGPTTKVRLQFAASVAPFIRERTWHDSQKLRDRVDGSVVMTLDVSDDYALRQWILGFGRAVRVLAPDSLVDWIVEELNATAEQYASGQFGKHDDDRQPTLPFALTIANA
jgi:predicted DNA-binding transcriptional regulator YafY